MSENLLINCVSFRLLKNDATIYTSENQIANFRKISKSKLTGDKNHRAETIYWSSEKADRTIHHSISSEEQRSLFRDFLNGELYLYLKDLGVPHKRSFLGGTEIWLEKDVSPLPNTTAYKAYTLRVLSPSDQHATTGWTLQVIFKGEKITYTNGDAELKVPEDLIHTFVHDLEISSVKHYADKIPEEKDVLLDPKIAQVLGAAWPVRLDINKYLTFFNEVTFVYERYLKGKQIGTAIQVLESGFGRISESQVWKTTVDSNVLEFGNGRTHFNAYMGLKEYGPLSGPTVTNYRFFFIFHESSRDHANKLYQYFNRGFKGYPGLKSFVGIDLILDKERTIVFKSLASPSTEILRALSEMEFEKNTTYHAIYLTPISRDDPDEDAHADYFKVKESLLELNIGSQTLFRENIDKPNFNFSLPNISIALLAKLGGRPWRLNRVIEDELVFGIGAYRDANQQFLGTTFTFRNDGTFVGFDAANCNTVEQLGEFFETAIRQFVSEQESISRVVIHFFKRMSNPEERELIRALARLNLQVPYVVVTISAETAREYVIFDKTYSGRMPQSGTCVMLRHGEFLLCNNTRYQKRTSAKIDDFPFPIRVSISRTSISSIGDLVTQKLIDQVYQFSRMYWRSVKQRPMPVTILYSEKIAQMTANFPDKAVPDTEIAKKTLWFL